MNKTKKIDGIEYSIGPKNNDNFCRYINIVRMKFINEFILFDFTNYYGISKKINMQIIYNCGMQRVFFLPYFFFSNAQCE